MILLHLEIDVTVCIIKVLYVFQVVSDAWHRICSLSTIVLFAGSGHSG